MKKLNALKPIKEMKPVLKKEPALKPARKPIKYQTMSAMKTLRGTRK